MKTSPLSLPTTLSAFVKYLQSARQGLTRDRTLLAALAVAVFTTGLCGCSRSPETMLQSAKQYIEKKDDKAALLELKNALAKYPNLVEGRYLLGTLMLKQKDFPSAEKELQKALELGYDKDILLIDLATATLRSGHEDKVVTEFALQTLSDPKKAAQLKSIVGSAWLAQGKLGEASAAFDRALELDGDSSLARLGQANLSTARGNLESAEQLLREASKKDPSNPEILKAEGRLAQAKGSFDLAIEKYRAAISAEPLEHDARSTLTELLIERGELDEARQQIALLQKIPNWVHTSHILGALLAYKQGKPREALDLANKALRVVPNHVPALVLAGMTSVNLGEHQHGQEQLRKALYLAPKNIMARVALIASYIATAEIDGAQKQVNEGLAITQNNAGLLAVAGELAMRKRDLAAAERYVEKALALEPKNAALLAKRGEILSAKGNSHAALEAMEQAASVDSESTQSDTKLALHHLRKKQYAQAKQWIDKIESKKPNEPVAPMLTGLMLSQQKDYAGARKQFDLALKRNPGYLPALENLAKLDIAEKRPGDAASRYESAATEFAGNEALALSYDQFLRRQRAPLDKRILVLERTVKSEPRALRARLALNALYLESGAVNKALVLSQEALALAPENPAAMAAAAKSQLAAGDKNQALASAERVVSLQPRNAEAYLLLSSIHQAMGRMDKAIEALKKATNLAPNDPRPRVQLVRLHSAAGDKDAALSVARETQKRWAQNPIGYELEAQTLASMKNWPAAALAYKQALNRAPSTMLAVRTHENLTRAGQGGEAQDLARKWLVKYAQDTGFREYLAETALQKGDAAAAKAYYEEMVRLEPKNPLALSRLALVLGKLNDPKSITVAEQALAMAPQSALLMANLGGLLVSHGDAGRGVKLLKDASKAAPKALGIRVNLAKALIKTGDKTAARAELELVIKESSGNPIESQAQELLRSL